MIVSNINNKDYLKYLSFFELDCLSLLKVILYNYFKVEIDSVFIDN